MVGCCGKKTEEEPDGDVFSPFHLDLPGLKYLTLHNSVPAGKEFARSVRRCINIEELDVYKYTHAITAENPLYLPKCERMKWSRGDAVKSLAIYAPKAGKKDVDVDLGGCCFDGRMNDLRRLRTEPFALTLRSRTIEQCHYEKAVRASCSEPACNQRDL